MSWPPTLVLSSRRLGGILPRRRPALSRAPGTHRTNKLKKSPLHEISYQCATKLLYAVTRAQESGQVLVHMFLVRGVPGAGIIHSSSQFGPWPAHVPASRHAVSRCIVLTPAGHEIQCLRAARRGGTFHFAPNPS